MHSWNKQHIKRVLSLLALHSLHSLLSVSGHVQTLIDVGMFTLSVGVGGCGGRCVRVSCIRVSPSHDTFRVVSYAVVSSSWSERAVYLFQKRRMDNSFPEKKLQFIKFTVHCVYCRDEVVNSLLKVYTFAEIFTLLQQFSCSAAKFMHES